MALIQALDRVLQMSNPQKKSQWNSVMNVNGKEWARSPDYRLSLLLGIFKPDKGEYRAKTERSYTSYESSVRGQRYLTSVDGVMFAIIPAMVAYSEARYQASYVQHRNFSNVGRARSLSSVGC